MLWGDARTLHDLVGLRAAAQPGAEAAVDGEARLTNAELAERVDSIARALLAAGVRPGDRVATLAPPSLDFWLTFLAAAGIGAVWQGLNPKYQRNEYAYLLADASPRVVFVRSPFDGRDYLEELQALAAHTPRFVPLGDVPLDGAHPFVAEGAAIDAGTLAARRAAVQPEDPAVVVYTSGTTGRPKGAMLTHLGIVHSSMHFALAMDLGPQDATVAAVPLSHVTGLVALTTTFVYCAGKMVIMPAFKAADYLRIAGSEGITHSLMVPAMYKLCLLDPSFDQYDLSAWRIGAYGGAPMPVATIVELAEKVPELVLMNCYGATETTSPATVMPPGQTRAHNDTVGQSLHCVDMRVMDDEGRELPPGTLGEIWIKGPMVVRGYWDNPQATQEHITGGYWHSGDLGTIDAQGFVRVMDRKKDMINRGGFKIYTIEVENALYEHAGVQECAVVAKPCPVLGERVHAFVSLKPGCAPSAELPAELKAHCAARLSDYKVPESYTVLTTPLPRNANGKLLKREMREQVLRLSPVLDKRS